MRRYRTKPVFVDALQVTDATFDAPHPNPEHLADLIYDPVARTVTLPTGEVAGLGDWIIRNAAAELHVFSADAFAAQFEPD